MDTKLKPIILIAEDETVNFMYIEEVLSSLNYNILLAKNGKEAIDLFFENEDKISLVLLDIKMPVMNGFEVLEAIKQKNSKVPIIAQTAFALKPDIDKAMKAGFNDYLVKPISRKKLISTIAKHLDCV